MGSITSRRALCSICGLKRVIAFETFHDRPIYGGMKVLRGHREIVPVKCQLCAECLDEDVEIEQESRRGRFEI